PAGGPVEPIRTALQFLPGGETNLQPNLAAEIYTSGEKFDGVRWVSAVSAGSGLRSFAVPHGVDRLPEVNEVEPNDAPASAMSLQMPVICNGRIQTPGDVDSYALQLRKGEQVQISIVARAGGSSVWPAVRVLGADGKPVAATAEDGSNVPNV